MKSSRRNFLLGVGSSIFAMSSLSHFGINRGDNTKSDTINVNTKIIGHRGCSAKKEDNSLEGIKCAIESGADGVEIDIHKTKDDRLILNHDPQIMTGNDIFIISRSNLDELQSSSEEIVLLEEALDLLVDVEDFDIYLDLKSSMIADDVLELVKSYELVDSSVLLSWSVLTFESVEDSDIRKALVSYFPSTQLVDRAYKNDIDAVIPHYTSQNLEYYIQYAHENNIGCGYWAISDTQDDIELGLRTQPDFIITNRPSYAYKKLIEAGEYTQH